MCVWPWPGWGAGSRLSGLPRAGQAVFFFSGRPVPCCPREAGGWLTIGSAAALISDHGCWLTDRLVLGILSLSPWR